MVERSRSSRGVRKKSIVSSPEFIQERTERFIYFVKARKEAEVVVTIITMESQNISYGKLEFCQKLINEMQETRIHVIVKDGVNKHFVIIDAKLVWHGGMNLLSKEGAWDNLMRIMSDQVVAELLEVALKNQENIKKG